MRLTTTPPKGAYRIAHLSDLHLTRIGNDFERCLALVEDAAAHGAEHLVISGDLVESGEMEVLREFVAALKSLGWSGSKRLTIIPGNHDIFPATKKIKKPTIRRPTSIFRDFVEITRGSRGSRVVKGSKVLCPGEPYPFGKVLNNEVVLVGLDTTRNSVSRPWCWASGELSEEEMSATEDFLSEHSHIQHRIVVMHHHPWEEQFEGGGIFEQNFVKPSPDDIFKWLRRSNATLVLCGHVHHKTGIEKKSLGTGRMVFRAGTAGGVNDKHEGDKRRIYHLLDLNLGGAVSIHAREFLDSAL